MVSRLRRIPPTTSGSTSPSTYNVNEQKQSPKRRNIFFFKRRQHDDNREASLTETMQQTRVVPMLSKAPAATGDDAPIVNSTDIVPATTVCQPTSSLFQLCGLNSTNHVILPEEQASTDIPDDPTVEESIECVIAASQGELADLLKSYDEFPATPSYLQQSLLKNRSFERMPPRFQSEAKHRSPQGSYRSVPYDTPPPVAPPRVCACCRTFQPPIPPNLWPQRPLLLRPTPKSGTVVKGIRFANAVEYLWTPDSIHTWMHALDLELEKAEPRDIQLPGCRQCVALPINNGDELNALVTDFESELFVGTLLLRIRDANGTTDEDHRLSQGYFYGLNRRYQVVIRGKFKQEIPWTECFTGFQLERPAGKLPPKWIINGALNVIKFFAPQVRTQMHGDRPFSLTPLGSTPQVLAVDKSTAMEKMQEEPTEDHQTLLGQASNANSSMQRARYRKKTFDRMFAASDDKSTTRLVTDPNKEYTFEFLQHLFNFEDFSIELGSMLGSVSLQSILAGQALQIMASHGPPSKLDGASIQNRLWSFDIWHEMLLEVDSGTATQ